MSFRITHFSELCVKFPTWPELKAYLESKDGGSLRCTVVDDLAIIKYVKGVSDLTKPHVASFRSVVWNTVANRPVSVAPVKAIHGDPPVGEAVHVSDFVDGTMIQGWNTAGKTMIATRSSIGARGTFYSARPFAELFEDAVRSLGGTQKFLSSLADGQFASFILQHREHKTVAPIAYARIFVAYVGSVEADGTVTMSSSSTDWPDRFAAYAPPSYGQMTFDSSAEIHQHLRDLQQGYTWQGLVFEDAGRRWRIRNPSYILVRNLRGAEADPMARFLRLRASGQMKQYLTYFREENGQLWTFEQLLRQRSQELYDAYNAMNKFKTKKMKELPYCLRPHVYALHGNYLDSIPEKWEEAVPCPILKKSVVEYVNALSQEDQLKLLRGDAAAAAPAAPAKANL